MTHRVTMRSKLLTAQVCLPLPFALVSRTLRSSAMSPMWKTTSYKRSYKRSIGWCSRERQSSSSWQIEFAIFNFSSRGPCRQTSMTLPRFYSTMRLSQIQSKNHLWCQSRMRLWVGPRSARRNIWVRTPTIYLSIIVHTHRVLCRLDRIWVWALWCSRAKEWTQCMIISLDQIGQVGEWSRL